jgi:CRISPR-associated exonuclease Cas4
MAFSDDELLPISALQHLVFCERQCALIHVEREWEENRLTAEGRTLHERVDEGYREFRRGLRQFSSVRVRSTRLGIYGHLDVVEAAKSAEAPDNAIFLGLEGTWNLYPVEFKRGKPKSHDADKVQVCAQALCLEEMTRAHIAEGALFYGEIRRREAVVFDETLRMKTVRCSERLHELIDGGVLPPPVWKRHCRACSLLEACQPRAPRGDKAAQYREELFK